MVTEIATIVSAIISTLTFVLALIIHTKVEVVREETKVNGLREIQIEAMTKYLMERDRENNKQRTTSS